METLTMKQSLSVSEKIFSGSRTPTVWTGRNLFVAAIFPFFVLSQWVYLCRYLDNKTRSVWKPHGALLNGCWRQSTRKNCAISPFRPRRNLFAQLSSGIGSARGDGTREGEREPVRRRRGKERGWNGDDSFRKTRGVLFCLAMPTKLSINIH